MSYAIQVERIEASMVDRSGKAAEVTFFLHTVSPHSFATETVADRLNDLETDFLPCEVQGRTELIRLGAVSYVEIPDLAPEVERLEETGAMRSRVRLDLDCGTSLVGELIYEAPPTTDRVSDLLNARATRFVLLLSEGRTLFVRRNAIDSVLL